MSEPHYIGHTLWDIVVASWRDSRAKFLALVGVIIFFLAALSAAAYRIAEPCSNVSIIFGWLIFKKPCDTQQPQPIDESNNLRKELEETKKQLTGKIAEVESLTSQNLKCDSSKARCINEVQALEMKLATGKAEQTRLTNEFASCRTKAGPTPVVPTQISPESLDGNWQEYISGRFIGIARIDTVDGALRFTNGEMPAKLSNGKIGSKDTVQAYEWRLRANVMSNGRGLAWSNGVCWFR